LAQNIGETIAIVAVALISIIFALYLIILRKNGWLGGKSSFYRCPNQECKKVFQKPIELKDLSMNPPRTYPACPECGTNLDPFFNLITKRIPKIRSNPTSNQTKNEIKQNEKKAPMKRAETTNQKQKQMSTPKEKTPTTKPEIRPTEAKRIETLNQNQSQKQLSILKEKTPTTKTTMENRKLNTIDYSGCEYFFGYLSTLNIKEESIPLICLECPKTLDCLVSKNK